MKQPTRTLQEEVEATIRKWILTGRYLEGAWLPSIAQLCKHFKVSDKTVKIALNKLKQENLLKGVNGRGLQVCRKRKSVLVLSRRRVKPDWSNMSPEEAVLRTAVESWHEQIFILGRDNDSALGPDLRAHADRIRAADVVVTYGIQNEDYHLQLAEYGRPVLAIDFWPARAAISSASHASFQAGYTATRHFLDLGHRCIAFLGVCRRVLVREPHQHYEQLPESDTELADSGYRQALRDFGIEPVASLIAKDTSAPDPQTLLNLVRQNPAPTAVVCWTRAGGLPARQVLEGAGIRVPEHLSLCQAVSLEHPETADYTGTAVEFDLRPVMQLSTRSLQYLLNDPKAQPQVAQIVPTLRVGDTSAAPR